MESPQGFVIPEDVEADYKAILEALQTAEGDAKRSLSQMRYYIERFAISESKNIDLVRQRIEDERELGERDRRIRHLEVTEDAPEGTFWVNGLVAVRNKRPYLQLSNEKGIIAQLSMAQTQKIASDMLVMAARTEADAMILKFFDRSQFPDGAAAELMMMFRDFRAELDQDEVEGR